MTKCIHGIIALMVVFVSHNATAQGYEERAKNYVKQYAAYAIADQKASGVPASITLAQGILETEAGISELVTEANNHFGIKCKNGWDGPTFLHTDDAKDECFKKYRSALESYNDHSAHLHRNPRYSSLFSYSVTDYARWAHGLKKCGYATNPKYGPQLIKIIEDYHLQQYTYAALDSNFDFTTTEDGQVIASATTPPQVEVVTTKDMTQSVGATTVITTTTTTTKTIRIEPTGTATEETTVAQQPGKAPAKPAVASMPASSESAIIKDSTKNGLVAVSATTTAMISDAPKPAADSTPAKAASPYLAEEPLDTTGAIQTINGLKAVRAHKEEALLPLAIKYKVRYAHLLEMNDLPDQPLEFDSWIYLEKKNPTGIVNAHHTVRENETLIEIAQAEGMQLRRLAALNLLNPFEQPAPGEVLNLQTPAATKPKIIDYKTPRSLPKQDVTADRSNAVYKEAQDNLSYGMSMEAPKDAPVLASARPQDTTRRDIVRQPFMKEDPPQKQVQQPATEPEYKKGSKQYLVKRGETAFSIAKKHNITVAQLLEWNHLDPQDLKAGQTLIIKQ